MSRVASLTNLDDKQLNRLIKRVALLLVVGTIAFVAFYVIDRWRPATTPIIDRDLAAAEQAVRDRPEDIPARGQLADKYVRKGRHEEAIAQYNAILETGQEEQLARYGRGNAYVGLGRYDEASADYKRVVEIAKGGEMAGVDPLLATTLYKLGSIAMKQAKPAEAIPYLEQSLAIKRADADTLYLIGTAFAATGETAKAEKSLRGAIAFVPVGWAEPYAALAEAFTKAGQAQMAEWAAAMAAGSSGDVAGPIARLKALVGDPVAGLDAMIGLGVLYELSRDSGSAAEWYGKALARNPESPAARLGLSRVSAGAAASPLPALPTPGAPVGNN